LQNWVDQRDALEQKFFVNLNLRTDESIIRRFAWKLVDRQDI
jgi:hypothetical protein